MLRRLIATMLLASLAGCSDNGGPTATSPPSAAPVSASASDDQAGLRACDLLKQAIDGATLMNPGVVDAIAAASTWADAPISDAAVRLAEAYAKAVAARGSDKEPDAVAAVSVAGAEMTDTCRAAGLETVG